MQKFLSQIVVRLSNTSRVLDMSDFWIFLRQGSSYASGCNCGRVLNIPEFSVCQVSSCASVAQIERITQATEYPRISPNIFYQCLNMHKYTLITLNMIEYACIYLKKKTEYWILHNSECAWCSAWHKVTVQITELLYQDRNVFKTLSNF